MRCDHGVLGIRIQFTCLFPIEMIFRVIVLKFAGKLGFELFSIETSDQIAATFTIDHGFPAIL